MNISNRLADINSLLDEVEAKSGDDRAVQVYENLASKFTVYDEVKEIRNKRDFLKENGVSIKSLKDDAKRVNRFATTILERFNERPEHSSLTQGQTFNNVIDELEKFKEIQEESLNKDWKEHCDGMFTEFTPNNVETEIPETPDNQRFLRDWDASYNEYLSISQAVPHDLNVMNQVIKETDKLKKIYSQFNRDVPPDVTKFMAGIKNGLVTLELLTPVVLKYLNEKNLLSKYRVTPRHTVYGRRDE